MKRYRIVHRTYYNFSTPVKLGAHALLLRPREDHELRIESSVLNIDPTATLRWQRDAGDNSVAIASFSQPSAQLAIESEVIIQQYNLEPFNFLVAEYAVDYPFLYQPEERLILGPYMHPAEHSNDNSVGVWTAEIWRPGEPIQSYALLERLTERIHAMLEYRVREEPGVQSSGETLSRGTGSCRDAANLFIEAARRLGLAARFVSGYLNAPPSPDSFGATHAWAEVFLPGVGWKGFDPTIGTIVGSDHIPVAVSRVPELVPPVAGSYVGTAESTLDVGVWVTELPQSA